MASHLNATFGTPEDSGSQESLAPAAQIQEQRRRIAVLQEIIAAQQERIHRLHVEQGRLDTVFDAALQSFLLVDPDGTIQAVNSTFTSVAEAVFGRAPAAGDCVEDFVRAQDLDTFRANFQRALRGETVVVTRRFDVDGSSRWFRFAYTPVSRNDVSDGEPAPDDASPSAPSPNDTSPTAEAVILQSVDVTGQKVAEDALLASETRHRSLVHDALDTSAAGVFILDDAFRIVWINQAAARFFRLDRNVVLGADKKTVLREQIAPRLDEPEVFTRRILNAYADNSAADRFTCTVAATGDQPARHLEHQSHPIRQGYYAGGRVEHYYDVTALKNTEADLEDARERAERHDQDTERFLANVSHEIRSSMTGITGFADLLLDADLDDEAHRFASIIRESGNAVLDLLNDVLDLSRLEAGTVVTDPHPFALAPALQSAVNTVRSTAQRKGLDLLVEIDGSLPDEVVGDEMRIRQILVNLLTNAVKFTDAGRVCLSADTSPPADLFAADAYGDDRSDDASASCLLVHLSVADTGIGLTEDEQETLFDAFQQAHPSTSREHGGSGLGLAIVKELVEAMDGALAVDSTPGEGSTFHVVLPLQRGPDASDDAAS